RGEGGARREPLAVLRPRRRPHDTGHRRPRGSHRPVHAGGQVTGGAPQAPRFEPVVGSAPSTGGVIGSSVTDTSAAGSAHASALTGLRTRQLAAESASGQVSAREALADHLARLDAVNPSLNAVVTRDDDRAYAEADAADRAYSRGERLSPLHGVPM